MAALKKILYSYSPEDIDILIAGAIKITGYADGTFVNIAKDGQTFVTKLSSDGQVSRTHTNIRTYNVDITLHSAAESNQVLTYLHAADDISKMAKFPLIIKDNLGSTLLFAPSAWIEHTPDTTFSTEITERQWTIKCANASMNIGGNDGGTSMAEDILTAGLGQLGGIL